MCVAMPNLIFDRSVLKDVGKNTGELPKLGSAGTPPLGTTSDLVYNPAIKCVCTNRREPPKLGSAEITTLGWGVADRQKQSLCVTTSNLVVSRQRCMLK